METRQPTRQALEQRLLRRRAVVVPPARPTADETVREYPLSHGQRQMWLFEQLSPGGGVGNFAFTTRLRGDLDVAALRAAITHVTRRHDVLRTVLRPSAGGDPVAVVAPPAEVPVPFEDLAGLPDATAEVERIAAARARLPFRLEHEPPVRWQLCRLAADDHVLLLNIHHIAADGWSESVLNRDLAACYDACRAGREPDLPALDARYADFARWQAERTRTGAAARDLDYWRTHLAGVPTTVTLPFDRAPQAGATFAGAVYEGRLPADLVARLERLARAERASLFMVVLTGFAATLAAFGGGHDMVVGTPVAGRGRREFEQLVGYFVNTLPLRVDLSGAGDFRTAIRRVRDTTLDSFAHQNVPLERIVADLDARRPAGRQPLVQASLQVHNTPVTAPGLAGLVVTQRQLRTETASLDLGLNYVPDADGLLGVWEYRTDLFDEATVRLLDTHLVRLLDRVTREPGARLSDLGDAAANAGRELVRAAHGPSVAPDDELVHEQFTAHALAEPDRVALRTDDGDVGYGELNARANRLAHRLRALGVGPDVVVGILLPRGADLVTSVLAVLKAGGGYLPLDPSYPDARLAAMVADARPGVVIGAADLLPRLGDTPAVHLTPDDPPGHPDTAPPRTASPDTIAYLIYTSGSTGVPKGVVVPHGGFANYVRWAARVYPATPAGGEHGGLLHSSAAFDLTVTALFVPLVTGGSIRVMPDRWRVPDLADELARDPGLAVAKLTPTHFAALRTEFESRGGFPGSVRAFVLGGEALRHDLVAAWRRLAPDARVFNEYGPTETVVGCSGLEVDADELRGASVVLGTPADNTTMYALAGNLSPVPVGAIGELYVGGRQVTRGYAGKPSLTAARFVPDPYSETPGARLYRTGDLVRVLAPGEYEFAGRVDHEVKVRGYRVDLEEITAALLTHPGVTDAVAVVRQAGTDGAHLAAYVAGPAALPPRSLRDHLLDRLPRHLVPGAYQWVDRIPLTDNGKVDTEALATHPLAALEAVRAEPTTDLERGLARIWAEVLDIAEPGIDEDFFELGGQSLLAGKVVSGFRGRFPHLSADHLLADLFTSPTVRGLAAATEQRGAHRAAAPPRASGEHRPLSAAQLGIWMQEQLYPDRGDFLVPQVLWLSGELDADALRTALRRVADRHEVLRTVVRLVDEEPVGLVLPASAVQLTVEEVAEDAVTSAVTRECATPIDTAQDPPLRARLLRVGPATHVLCLTCHHIATDGASHEIMARELAAAYREQVTGTPAALPDLPVQYADAGTSNPEQEAADLRFWRDALGDVPPLRLPLDRPRPARRSGAGGAVFVPVPAEVVDRLTDVGRRHGATLFMTVFTAFQLLLRTWTGQDRFVVATPVSGRGTGADGLIGLFVTMMPLPADLSGDPAAPEALRRSRATVSAALARRHVSLDRLVRALRPRDQAATTPLFRVSLDVAPDGVPVPDLDGLVVRRHPIPVTTSKYDLSVSLTRDDGQWVLELNHDTDLFDATTITALGERLRARLAVLADELT